MNALNEKTACMPSVGADAGQSINNLNESIPTEAGECKGNLRPPLQVVPIRGKHFDTVTMEELFDTVYDSTPPVIEGLLYNGVSIIAGSGKVGKSFLMAQIGYHVSTGTPLWGMPVRKCKVLYLALEDSFSRLQKRLYQMFGGTPTKDFVLTTSAGRLGDSFDEQLINFLEENPDTGLVIIDTLIMIRDTDGDNYSYSEDYDFIMKLKQFALRRNICIVLVHHTRKEGSSDPFDMISGTKGLYAAADASFVLMKDKRESGEASLYVTGRDQPDAKLSLVRDPEKLTWELDSVSADVWTEPKDPVIEAVAKLVAEENPVWEGTSTELAELIGTDLKPNALSMKLNVKAGMLRREYGIQYTNTRKHEGRRIQLTLMRDDV